MLVTMVLPSLSRGGAERSMALLAQGLAERGHDVTIAACRRQSGPDVEVSDEVRVVRCERHRTMAAVPDVRRTLRSARPDVVVGAMEHGNLAALAAAAGLRIPVVATFHGDPVLGREHGVYGRVRPWVAGSLVLAAQVSVAVSPSLAHVLRGLAPTAAARVVHIPNAVLTAELTEAVPWERPAGAPVRFVLWAGRMVAAKDPMLMVRTAALLRSREHTMRSVMLGDGPMRPEIRAAVNRAGLTDVVLLPGHVEDPYPWMHAAEVLLLTSRREGLGNVLIEAGALGTPVVSVDCPSGPADVLRNRTGHRLVEERSPEALADAVLEVLAAPEPPSSSWDAYKVATVSARFDAVLTALVAGRSGDGRPAEWPPDPPGAAGASLER